MLYIRVFRVKTLLSLTCTPPHPSGSGIVRRVRLPYLSPHPTYHHVPRPIVSPVRIFRLHVSLITLVAPPSLRLF